MDHEPDGLVTGNARDDREAKPLMREARHENGRADGRTPQRSDLSLERDAEVSRSVNWSSERAVRRLVGGSVGENSVSVYAKVRGDRRAKTGRDQR